MVVIKPRLRVAAPQIINFSPELAVGSVWIESTATKDVGHIAIAVHVELTDYTDKLNYDCNPAVIATTSYSAIATIVTAHKYKYSRTVTLSLWGIVSSMLIWYRGVAYVN